MIEVPALIPDLTNEEYHADKSFFSRSALMDFDRCPYQYWARHLNPDRPQKDATPQMIMGSAFHTLILEPHLFEKNYLVMPEKVLLKNVGREAYEEYKKIEREAESCKGKVVLSRNDYECLLKMQHTFNRNERAKELIEGALYELSYFWQDKDSEMNLKCRPDALHPHFIVDLKTCSDASPRAFQNEMVRYGYHVQGAMVRAGVEAVEWRRINTVINVCIETKYPHTMAIYVIDEEAIDAGERKYKELCLALKSAIGHNEFADYGIQNIGLPRWAYE